MLKIDGQLQLNLNSQQELYNKLIPEDHKFKRLLELTDFNFIIDE